MEHPSTSKIKYVRKFSFLHALKIYPEKISKDLITILCPLFPEVQCEQFIQNCRSLFMKKTGKSNASFLMEKVL